MALPVEEAERRALKTVEDLVRAVPALRTRKVEVTCERCPLNDTCDLAFDLYNTDGDCLAEK